MNKKMRELMANIEKKTSLARGYMEGETKDVAKAQEVLDEVENLRKEYAVEAKLFEAEKAQNEPTEKDIEEVSKKDDKEVDGFKAVAKMLNRKPLTEVEKSALISTTDTGPHGEENLLPHDVQLAIQELRRQHLSARDLLSVTQVSTLTGQHTYEVGGEPKLSPLTDGDEITEAEAPKFKNIQWSINWYAKILPVSRILVGAERAGLMAYLDRWFIKSSVNTENELIFDELRKFNDGKAKAIKGWEELKRSINVDLDPVMLYDGVIVTNQTGFALLDEEKDENGRPILQPNPANPTEKLFQGLPVKVFPNSQLADVAKGKKAPIFYGSTKTALEFKEYERLQFGVSEHYLFNKNQNALRVLQGFTLLRTDEEAVIYGSFEASEKPAGETA